MKEKTWMTTFKNIKKISRRLVNTAKAMEAVQ
jgi:hypothetical protein